MKKPTVDRWPSAARGGALAKQARKGIPHGDCDVLIQMGNEWNRIPNALMEDADGNLWLAFMHDGTTDDDEGYEAVSVIEALTWAQHVSEFCDNYSGDIADVCRIALAELRRGPALRKGRRAGKEGRK